MTLLAQRTHRKLKQLTWGSLGYPFIFLLKRRMKLWHLVSILAEKK